MGNAKSNLYNLETKNLYMIIVGWKYADNTATFQRMWGLAKAVAANGYSVKFIFLMPNHGKKSQKISNLECLYLGEDFKLKSKLLCLIYSLFRLLFLIHKGDIVYYYTFCPILFVLSLIPKLNLFVEVNEYPPFMFGKKWWGKIVLKWYLCTIKRSKKIFVISKKLCTYFISQGIPANLLIVLNMTVDENRFKHLSRCSKERYVAYCGTVTNFKDGVHILLKSFVIVSQKVLDVKLYIIGNIPFKKDKEECKQRMRENSLEDRVYMFGSMDSDILLQYLKNAEILALARPDNIQAAYGFPTKVGEYLLTGNPCVVTRVGELDNFLQDKKSCLFAKPNSIESFAEQLLWLLSNPEEGKRIGENGKKVAESNFSHIIEAQKIIKEIISISEK